MQETALAFTRHYAHSALFGAGYGVLHRLLHVAPLPSGPLYGLGTYAATLVGVGPAMRLVPPPWQQERVTVGRQMMMHAVFGTVTALVARKVREKLA